MVILAQSDVERAVNTVEDYFGDDEELLRSVVAWPSEEIRRLWENVVHETERLLRAQVGREFPSEAFRDGWITGRLDGLKDGIKRDVTRWVAEHCAPVGVHERPAVPREASDPLRPIPRLRKAAEGAWQKLPEGIRKEWGMAARHLGQPGKEKAQELFTKAFLKARDAGGRFFRNARKHFPEAFR